VPKLARNVERDATNEGLLKAAGWDVLTVWECEIKKLEDLVPRLVEFLEDA
jgi:DNA mismatch endonuclease (patch repair protein)